MKQIYFFLLAALGSPFFTFSQAWTAHDPGISAPTLGTTSLDVVSEEVIWSVGTHFGLNDSLYSAFQDSICIVSVSTDGGASWSNHQAPLGNPAFVANLTAIDGQTAWLSGLDAGGGGSKILKTSDGGATWTEQTSANWDPAASWVDFTYFWSGAKGVSMGDPTQGEFEIYTTANGGALWFRVDGSKIPDPLPGEFGFNGGYDVLGNTVWFVTSAGRVYRSKNAGFDWEAFETGLPVAYSVSFRDENVGFVSATDFVNFTSQVKITTDGGETWNDIASLPEGGNARIEYGLANVPGTNALVVGTSAGSLINGTFKTWLTRDDGATWTQIDEGHHISWPEFISSEVGWAGQSAKLTGPSNLFEFTSDVLGLFDQKPLAAEVQVFPNPTSGMFRLNVRSPQITDFLLLVNDAQGRLVRREVVAGVADFQRHIDLSGLATGVYSVTVSSAEGSFSTKILKQ